MEDERGTTHAQLKNIDTSQPTPMRGLVLRGVKVLPTVNTEHGGIVGEAEYDEEKHGEIVKEKLPTRKKKNSAETDGGGPAKKAAKNKGSKDDDDG